MFADTGFVCWTSLLEKIRWAFFFPAAPPSKQVIQFFIDELETAQSITVQAVFCIIEERAKLIWQEIMIINQEVPGLEKAEKFLKWKACLFKNQCVVEFCDF